MNKSKSKGLTREQAAELYKDLQKTLNQTKEKKQEIETGLFNQQNTSSISSAGARLATEMKRMNLGKGIQFSFSGQSAALILLVAFAIGKISLSALEFSGFAQIETAEASISGYESRRLANMSPAGDFSKEEIEILTQLDKRRAELENRSEKITERDQDLGRREMEMAARLTELKSLTDELRLKRDQNDRKKSGQLEQLSKVYSSMAPEEAAKLMEQLDITISLSLLQRMPEKRIAQILALMNPERALSLTRMLTQ